MLDLILKEKNITAYALAQKSEVPYSTISDLVSGKTSLEKVSASVLYKLSRALGMTMEQIYLYQPEKNLLHLYNENRTVHLSLQGKNISYMGPKNLVAFKRINKVSGDVIYVDTYYLNRDHKVYSEEEYVDLRDAFAENACEELLDSPYEVCLGRPEESRYDYLVKNALLVSDRIAIQYKESTTEDLLLEAVNLKRNNESMLLRLKDYAVLSTGMSENMQKRAIAAVKRNEELIVEELKEMGKYA